MPSNSLVLSGSVVVLIVVVVILINWTTPVESSFILLKYNVVYLVLAY